MRTLLIGNSLVTNGAPTAKGAIGIINGLGNAQNITSGQAVAASLGEDAQFELIQANGNGSFRTFTLTPNNFQFSVQESGANAEIPSTETVTWPSGNALTDSMGQYFAGGIRLQKWRPEHSIWEDVQLIPVQVVGSSGVVANADVITAFKNAIAPYVGAGKYFTSKTEDGTNGVYTYADSNYKMALTGDFRNWVTTTIQGMTYINTGVEMAKLERELAPNMGSNNTIEKLEWFAESNFIVDTSVNYHIIQITSATPGQRPLIKNSGGFPKSCTIIVPTAQKAAVYDVLVNFLTKLKAAGLGSISAL